MEPEFVAMACLTLMADVEEYDMKKSYLLVLLVSVLLYLCLTPVKLFGSVWVCSWSSSWSYALLSWLVCDKVNPKGTGENVVLAMLLTLGYFIVDIPVRIIDFEGTFVSLILLPVVAVSICLSLLCHSCKSLKILVLSYAILMIINTFVMNEWLQYCSERFGMRCF